MPRRSALTWTPEAVWVLVPVLALVCASDQTGPSEMMNNNNNYYQTLAVARTATDREIKKAFHRLAVKFHPDKNKRSNAEKAFREIAEAYEVLSDKEKRKQYDELGHESFLQNENGSYEPESKHEDDFFHFNLHDLFDSLEDDELFLGEPSYSWGFSMSSDDVQHENQGVLDSDFFDLHDHFYKLYEDDHEHF